jgi:hypothetical protein
MNQPSDFQTKHIPSKSELAKATSVALAIAVVLLTTVVLPAEYGIDPLGTGRMLGLMALSDPAPLPEEKVPDSEMLVPTQEGVVAHYAGEYKVDATEFTLAPYDYVEYKYRLAKDATMQYAWTATSDVIQDFHGQPEGGDSKSEQSYDKRQRRQAFGSISVPFAGIHGWYWENPGGTPVTVKLQTSGFYSAAVEIRSDRTRHHHDLVPLERITPPKAAQSTTGS